MSVDLSRRIALLTGGAAIVAMGALTAGCGTGTKEAPSTPSGSVTQSETPTLSPTEKKVAPLTPGGANSFTPTVNPAPPPATCSKIVGNTCIR